MDLTSLKTIKNLLKTSQIRPFKGLGQNFLISKSVLEKIIEGAEIKPDDLILEIGPGLGTLTQELARAAKLVVAIEKDKKMVEILKEILKDYKGVQIIKKDVLKLNFQFSKKYKIVANLPYCITSPVIRKFLEAENPPESMVLMVQKEKGQRICAQPPKMNLLAVSIQFYAKPKIVSYVSKECFYPQPKVDSAIIKIVPHQSGLLPLAIRPVFFKIVKAGFSQPRKQLVNNLTGLNGLNGVKLDKEKVKNWLLKNNIKPSQRAETLSIQDWLNLFKTLDLN